MDNEDTYFIPANFTDAGRVFGMFELRNCIEAVVLAAPTLGICMLIARQLAAHDKAGDLAVPAGTGLRLCAARYPGRLAQSLSQRVFPLAQTPQNYLEQGRNDQT